MPLENILLQSPLHTGILPQWLLSHDLLADRLIISLAALLLVIMSGLLIGPVAGNANPIMWWIADKLFGGVGRKAYKPERDAATLYLRGIMFSLFMMIGVLVLFVVLWALPQLYDVLNLSMFVHEVMLLALVLSGGAVWVSLLRLYKALMEGKALKGGSFYSIAVSTRVNLNSTDDFGITRVGLGFMAINFDKAVIAPLFWYLIGGLPMAYFYTACAVTRWAMAKEGFAKAFGDFALWLERILGLVPHIISAIIISCAALFTPSAHMSRAIRGLLRFNTAPYYEGGLVITAMAWALNVSLGGPVQDVDGSTLKRDWVGPKGATARIHKSHLKQAIYMSIMAYVLLLSMIVGGLLYTKLY